METANKKNEFTGFIIFLALIIFLLFLGLNLFSSHTSDFLAAANTGILPIILIFGSITALRFRYLGSNTQEDKQVWLLFGIGLGLYGIAEFIWLIYLFAGSEPPYPGPSDFFYVISYPFLILALFNKYKSLRIRPSKGKLAILWTVLAVVLVLTFIFVIYPIVSSPDAASIVETAVNLYYPLADLVYITVALLLIFVLWGGRISSSWILIGLSAIILALSDIVFIYADWNELYYPGNQINLVSEVADMGYLTFALLAAVGVFIQGQLLNITEDKVKSFLGTMQVQQPTTPTQEMAGTPKAGGVIFGDREDRSVYINDYLRNLILKFGGKSPTPGQPIREILGLDESSFQGFIDEVIKNVAARQRLEVKINNQQIPFSILGSARKNKMGEYDGTDMFLTLTEEGLNAQAHEDLKIAETGNYLLKDVWSKLSRIGQLDLREQKILAYLIVKFTSLYIFIGRMAGISAAQRLSDVFNISAKNAGIAIEMKDGNALFETPPATNKLGFILEEAMLYSQNLVSKESIGVFQDYFNQTIPSDILEVMKTDNTNS